MQEPPAAATGHWTKWATADVDYAWPDERSAAVCLTFDVDAETGPFSVGPEYHRRLTALSDARFSTVRGVPRILEMLRRLELPATFFVPGWTAVNHLYAIAAILEAGHEVGHHGYHHASSHLVSVDVQRRELERGFAAMEEIGAPRPRGYRSPSGEVTPETFEMLSEYDLLYDSSFMSDDRPYIERHGAHELVEIPWHWSLDDYPYFGYMLDFQGNVADPERWRAGWFAEYQLACSDGRSVVYTCHPEITGRGLRFVEFERLIADILDDGRAWFARMEDVARHVSPILSKHIGPTKEIS